jgi:glycosyltransferase involved in cell wall biosynthesis
MRVCVISPGVVHAVPRTVAIAPFFEDIRFLDVTGKADRESLAAAGIAYYGPEDAPSGRFSYRSTHSLLHKIRPDIIVCHFASGSHFFNAIAYGKYPVAVIAMGQDVLYDKGDAGISMLRRLLVRMGLRRAFYVAAKSTTLIDRINCYGAKAPVSLNYWGCDPGIFYPRDKKTAREALGLPADGKIILSPRAVEPRLNIHLIVEAVANVSSRHKDIMLVIIGRSNPDYKVKVGNLIAKRGLAQNTRILGEIPQHELPEYYAAADLVVSMAHSEGFPNTVLEVMHCMSPLVIGDLPQIHELLEDGVHCRICQISESAITDNIGKMLDAPHLGEEMSRHAKELANSTADISKNGTQFAKDLLQQVSARSNPHWMSRALFRAVYLVHRLAVRFKRA